MCVCVQNERDVFSYGTPSNFLFYGLQCSRWLRVSYFKVFWFSVREGERSNCHLATSYYSHWNLQQHSPCLSGDHHQRPQQQWLPVGSCSARLWSGVHTATRASRQKFHLSLVPGTTFKAKQHPLLIFCWDSTKQNYLAFLFRELIYFKLLPSLSSLPSFSP